MVVNICSRHLVTLFGGMIPPCPSSSWCLNRVSRCLKRPPLQSHGRYYSSFPNPCLSQEDSPDDGPTFLPSPYRTSKVPYLRDSTQEEDNRKRRSMMIADDHTTLFLRNYSSLASLALLLYEYVVTWQFEFRYIWKSPTRSALKRIYLFSRYFALLAQIINFVLILNPLSRIPVKLEHCRQWLLFLVLGCGALFAALDAVIMLRVYALYNRSPRVAIFLCSLFGLQALAIFSTALTNYRRDSYDDACNVGRTRGEGLMLGRNTGQVEPRLASMVVHEGSWIFVLMFAIVVLAVPYTFVLDKTRPSLVFLWPQSFFSIAACRLIMGMQRLHIHPFSIKTNDPERM
ncbi:hypothetical protein B0H34DRAFT_466802 [Crassisporium funariophilum]|nr:hypothetical protein B0H34DRAFT_466802 [Crassisporium funariophilum]